MISEAVANKLALISAVNAEIKGMETTNIERHEHGKGFAYGEEAFFKSAEELRRIAATCNIKGEYKHENNIKS